MNSWGALLVVGLAITIAAGIFLPFVPFHPVRAQYTALSLTNINTEGGPPYVYKTNIPVNATPPTRISGKITIELPSIESGQGSSYIIFVLDQDDYNAWTQNTNQQIRSPELFRYESSYGAAGVPNQNVVYFPSNDSVAFHFNLPINASISFYYFVILTNVNSLPIYPSLSAVSSIQYIPTVYNTAVVVGGVLAAIAGYVKHDD
ncbi:MAG: hypothetical protein JRN52_02020 [Nitrososphaerota archaeon]|nr:hypothetical protein [Nitrososphaerota archaeon]